MTPSEIVIQPKSNRLTTVIGESIYNATKRFIGGSPSEDLQESKP